MRVRHHLTAAAAATLGVQLLVAVLGTVVACGGGAHMHGRVPVDDCPMHHQAAAGSTPSAAAPHGHHAHAGTTDRTDTGAAIRCRCSSDAPRIFAGGPAVLVGALRMAVPAVPPQAESTPPAFIATVVLSPLSPPPRPSAA